MPPHPTSTARIFFFDVAIPVPSLLACGSLIQHPVQQPHRHGGGAFAGTFKGPLVVWRSLLQNLWKKQIQMVMVFLIVQTTVLPFATQISLMQTETVLAMYVIIILAVVEDVVSLNVKSLVEDAGVRRLGKKIKKH